MRYEGLDDDNDDVEEFHAEDQAGNEDDKMEAISMIFHQVM